MLETKREYYKNLYLQDYLKPDVTKLTEKEIATIVHLLNKISLDASANAEVNEAYAAALREIISILRSSINPD